MGSFLLAHSTRGKKDRDHQTWNTVLRMESERDFVHMSARQRSQYKLGDKLISLNFSQQSDFPTWHA